MSTWSVSFDGKGIGKAIICRDKDESGWSIVTIGDKEFELYDVIVDDNGISFREASCYRESFEIAELLAKLFPEVVISCCDMNNDGFGCCNYKLGMFDGEFKEWDFEEWNIYDDLEDDFFSLSHNCIKGEGIGKVISYEEIEDTVEDELFKVSIGEETFKLKKVSVTDDSFRFSDGAISYGEKIHELLSDMFPEVVFSYVSYEEDGKGYGYKCGIFDGEYKKWDFEFGNIDNELKGFM